MRSLTTSEIRLLFLCLLTIFIVFNIFLFKNHFSRYRADKAEIVRLKADIESNRVWADDRAEWEVHEKWIDANMPVMQSAGKEGGLLLESLQKVAYNQRFNLEKQALLEPEERENYQSVAAALTLKGDLADVTKWLASLQAPDSFQRIKNLRFGQDTKSQSEKPRAYCSVTVERWFKPRVQNQ